MNSFEEIKDYDFVLIIDKGKIMPKAVPNYYENRIHIKMVEKDSITKIGININGKEYHHSLITVKDIRKIISKYFDILIDYSKLQTKNYIFNHMKLDTGKDPEKSELILKYGNLYICVDANLSDEYSVEVSKLIDEIVKYIISSDNSMNEFILKQEQYFNEYMKTLKIYDSLDSAIEDCRKISDKRVAIFTRNNVEYVICESEYWEMFDRNGYKKIDN